MKLWAVGFLVGLALGISAMVVIPRFAGPYLPPVLKSGTFVEGTVVAKQREPDRLLMTLSTEAGSILVTFKKKIPEIDLLVEETNSLTLSMKQYQPFIEDPEILRVAKDGGLGDEAPREPDQPDNQG